MTSKIIPGRPKETIIIQKYHPHFAYRSMKSKKIATKHRI